MCFGSFSLKEIFGKDAFLFKKILVAPQYILEMMSCFDISFLIRSLRSESCE